METIVDTIGGGTSASVSPGWRLLAYQIDGHINEIADVCDGTGEILVDSGYFMAPMSVSPYQMYIGAAFDGFKPFLDPNLQGVAPGAGGPNTGGGGTGLCVQSYVDRKLF